MTKILEVVIPRSEPSAWVVSVEQKKKRKKIGHLKKYVQ